ncbi:MAG: aldo/keto reductase [Asgard group archaeon]|nr:aldo/keto reductase [Asgard group archaeon]
MTKRKLPQIGFGTWQITDPQTCIESVKNALEVGYRLIDTAQYYRNEEHVGEGIKQSGIKREQIVLCTKVWINQLSPKKVMSSTEKSLEKLGTDYIDIHYIHWPAGKYEPDETLTTFAELVDQGKIKHIGVSNFKIEHMEKALEILDKPIIANQIEVHPLHKERKLRDYLRKKNIKTIAYSPLAKGKIFKIPEITKLAKKYDVSEARITLAWHLSKENIIPIPKSKNKYHIADNYEALSLPLDYDDIDIIDNLLDEKKVVNPGHSPWR